MKATYYKKDKVWVCGCGSNLQASFNVKNIVDCPNEDLVCVWCFKKSKGGKI